MFPEVARGVSNDQFRGDFLATIYMGNETFGDAQLAYEFKNQWMSQQRPKYEIEMFPLPIEYKQPMFEDFLRSDHRNFWANGVPAIFLTDSGTCFWIL